MNKKNTIIIGGSIAIAVGVPIGMIDNPATQTQSQTVTVQPIEQPTTIPLRFTSRTPVSYGLFSTQGLGKYNAETETTTWYEEVDGGMFVGDRTYYQCDANGDVTERINAPASGLIESEFAPSPMRNETCSVVKDTDGIPTRIEHMTAGKKHTTITFALRG